MSCKTGEVYFRFLGKNVFHEIKDLLQRLALSSQLQICKSHIVWRTTSKNCSKKRAARAALLFFVIQPIKSLNCGVVVAVAAFVS